MRYKIYYQQNGRLRDMIMEADHISNLKTLKDYPDNIIKIKEIKPFNIPFNIFTDKQKTVFNLFKQIRTMLEANLTFNQTIELLLKTQKEPVLTELLSEIRYGIENSKELSALLKEHSDYIDPTSILFLDLGIKNGNIKEAVNSLVTIQEQTLNAKEKLKETLRYPFVLITSLLISIILMVLFVLPNFEFIFSNIKGELPLATYMLLETKNILFDYWHIFLSFLVLLYFLFILFYKKFTLLFDKILINKIPVLSGLLKNYTYYRFFLSISIIIRSKYKFQTALEHSKTILNNQYLKNEVEKTIYRINNGIDIPKAFEGSLLFDELTIELLYTAEFSNNYEKVLEDIASLYKKRFRESVKNFTFFIEPSLILFIALIVLWVILAVMVPVWDLSASL